MTTEKNMIGVADELQKRIDEASFMLTGERGKVMLDDIVDTLRGDHD